MGGSNDGATGTDAGTGATVDADVRVVLVAAVAENGVIGRDGAMPWYYPEDLRHFRETTMGSPVVMGRRTFESILDRLGEPLPGRTNIVLTTQERDFPAGVVRVGSVADAVGAASTEAEQSGASGEAGGDATSHGTGNAVYVVGGASVYEQFLPLADRLVLTEIHESFEGDTRFPDVDWSVWDEIDRDDRDELSFVTYARR